MPFPAATASHTHVRHASSPRLCARIFFLAAAPARVELATGDLPGDFPWRPLTADGIAAPAAPVSVGALSCLDPALAFFASVGVLSGLVPVLAFLLALSAFLALRSAARFSNRLCLAMPFFDSSPSSSESDMSAALRLPAGVSLADFSSTARETGWSLMMAVGSVW